jgi:predicted small secreted protein
MRAVPMMNWLKIAMMLSALTLPVALLAGCNTSEGFGEDLESVGEDIQEEAD